VVALFYLSCSEIYEATGGLFEFNSTLPVQGIQFILLTGLLASKFYNAITGAFYQRTCDFIYQTYLLTRANRFLSFLKLDYASKLTLIKRSCRQVMSEGNDRRVRQLSSVEGMRAALILAREIRSPKPKYTIL
jgi:hypothetical protein